MRRRRTVGSLADMKCTHVLVAICAATAFLLPTTATATATTFAGSCDLTGEAVVETGGVGLVPAPGSYVLDAGGRCVGRLDGAPQRAEDVRLHIRYEDAAAGCLSGALISGSGELTFTRVARSLSLRQFNPVGDGGPSIVRGSRSGLATGTATAFTRMTLSQAIADFGPCSSGTLDRFPMQWVMLTVTPLVG
jgi:hypothetical protein